MVSWKGMLAGLAGLAMLGLAGSALAQEDAGPGAYSQALKGKRVVLIPMAMGFDLAQGWTHYIKKEVEGFGGVFETRDPNWSVEAGAQAITELISADPKPSVLIVHTPDLQSYSKLLKKAQQAGRPTGTSWASSRPRRWSRAAARIRPRRSA